MSGPAGTGLVYSAPGKMQDAPAEVGFDVRDPALCMARAGKHPGSAMPGIWGVNGRPDRRTDRVERVERRLDLTDTQ